MRKRKKIHSGVTDGPQITQINYGFMPEEDALRLLSNTVHPDGSELNRYRKDIIMSMFLLYESSGIHRFEFGNTIISDKNALLTEISEYYVTDEDVHRCVSDYKARMDFSNIIINYCACCGGMIMTDKSPDCANENTNLHEFELSQLTCLHLSEDEYSKWDEYDNDLKKLFSVMSLKYGTVDDAVCIT